jgi:hypothetical protein
MKAEIVSLVMVLDRGLLEIGSEEIIHWDEYALYLYVRVGNEVFRIWITRRFDKFQVYQTRFVSHRIRECTYRTHTVPSLISFFKSLISENRDR